MSPTKIKVRHLILFYSMNEIPLYRQSLRKYSPCHVYPQMNDKDNNLDET